MREFNAKAARVFLLKFISEFSKKRLLLAKLDRHHSLIKHAVYSFKRHMFVKNREVKKFIENWRKEGSQKGMKIWAKDLAEAVKKFHLKQYVKEFWQYSHLLTE